MSKLSDIIGRGTLASRPAAGIEGRLYYATDGAGTLYRDNGATWDSVEGTGSGAAGALDDLTDVDTTGAASGDVLTYNGTGWDAQAPSGSSSGAGMILQLDAGAGITMDGSNLVSRWDDQSGHRNHFTQYSSGNQPTWTDNVVNGEPVVRFDNTDYLVLPLSADLVGRFTLAFVFAPKGTETLGSLLTWALNVDTGTAFLYFRRNSTNLWIMVSDAYGFQVAHTTDAFGLYVLTYEWKQWNLYINGVAQTTYAAYQGGQKSTSQNLFLGVGINSYGAVDVAALELYNYVMTSGERGTLETRLMTKYGLS